MRKICFPAFLFLLLTSTVFADTPLLDPQNAKSIDPVKEKEIRGRIGTLQIPFIKNESQIKDSKVKFYANTFAGTVFITDDEIVYGLRGGSTERGGAHRAVPKRDYRRSGLRSFVGANLRVRPGKDTEWNSGWIIKEKFLNAKQTEAIGIKEAETKVSYFKGNDPANWKSNISTYQEIGLGEVYDHIKLNLKAYGKNIEKLFIVEKGGKPEDIAIKVEGAKGLKVNEKGELEVETDLGTMKMTKPVAFQEIDRKRVDVAVNYVLHAPSSMPHAPNPESPVTNPECMYVFNVGKYNKEHPLNIDPLLASTYIGGANDDCAYAIAIDSSENVFIAGWTNSSDFPTTTGGYDTSFNSGGHDAFVSKLNNALTTLLASTYIGGSDLDNASALAIDSSGNVFVAGTTGSSNFPTTAGAYDTSYNVNYDAFVSKLNNSLTILLASTFIGGVTESMRIMPLPLP